MKNQFVYMQEMKLPPVAPETEEKLVKLKASFNLQKVIRSLTYPDGSVEVLLDDFNERVSQEPDINLKTNKMVGYKSVRQTVQSVITLSKEDGERFFNVINVETNE